MKSSGCFNLTRRQREKVAELRLRLGELGYFIFAIARRLRKHRHDFLAVHKNNPATFFLVRPTRYRSVTIQPYGPTRQPHAVAKLVEHVRSIRLLVHWVEQIPLNQKNLRLEHFLTEVGEREYRRLSEKQNPAGS